MPGRKTPLISCTKTFVKPLRVNANEIQIPYDKHLKVYSFVKIHQNTYNSVKYEVPVINMKTKTLSNMFNY